MDIWLTPSPSLLVHVVIEWPPASISIIKDFLQIDFSRHSYSFSLFLFACSCQACNCGVIFSKQLCFQKSESWKRLWCIILKSCSQPADGVVSHMKISTICWPNVILLSYASKLLPTLTLKSLFWRFQGLRCYCGTKFDMK